MGEGVQEEARTNGRWLEDLRGEGQAADRAQGALRDLVAGAVRKATASRGGLDEATLEDLTQVAVVHVLQNLDRFEGRSKFTTWAYAVAVRAAFSELRRSVYGGGAAVRAEALTDAGAGALASPDEAPTRRAEKDEIVEVMHRVIEGELTERQRTAILGELSGRPRDELVAELGTNANAFHKLVHDARKRLREGLLAAGICDDQVREAFGL